MLPVSTEVPLKTKVLLPVRPAVPRGFVQLPVRVTSLVPQARMLCVAPEAVRLILFACNAAPSVMVRPSIPSEVISFHVTPLVLIVALFSPANRSVELVVVMVPDEYSRVPLP